MIFSNQHSWVVVGLVIIIGGIIRDYYNAKNQGKKIGVFPIDDDAWIDIGHWAEYKKAIDKF